MTQSSEQQHTLFGPAGSGKSLGAYYTDAQVADFLVSWAIRFADDRVMDPCFGGGVFLRSACKRLRALGGHPAMQVFGIEVDPSVYSRISEKLSDEFGVRSSNLFRADFFWFDTDAVQVDVIVGNPPFIRYQRFSGETRKQALEFAARQGVRLTGLSSSWAPFLVHSVGMLREGGRLAVVLPVEIAHAAYARPILDYLCRSFRLVTLLTFRKKLFPDLNEDTLLLLAEGKGSPSEGFHWRDFAHVGQLARLPGRKRFSIPRAQPLDVSLLVGGQERLIEHLLPRQTRELYRELQQLPWTRRLGQLADVGIGYVTGANDFFHLDPGEVWRRGIPASFSRPAVRRGRSFTGLRFTFEDWYDGLASGESGYLLHIGADEDLPESLRGYLEEGRRRGIPEAYKCRTRTPWYRVPHVYLPDALLTYMSGAAPHLVANEARVVAPNTLHVLRVHPGLELLPDELAALWQTALARLSVEIEGHALGGGMLKLEPTEAERVVLPFLPDHSQQIRAISFELDRLLRAKRELEATRLADRAILQGLFGLSSADCRRLRSAAGLLRDRRYARGAAA